jgi:hypothetical protein
VTAECPKCGAPPAGDACKTCGLATAKMAAFAAARDADVPVALRDAWQRAAERWDEPAAHDALFALVTAHSAYAWAASHYRSHKDAVAERQLARLRRAAEATLLAGATVRPDASTAPYRATRAVLVVLIVTMLVGLIYAFVMRGRAASPPTDRPVPAAPLRPGHPISPSTARAE